MKALNKIFLLLIICTLTVVATAAVPYMGDVNDDGVCSLADILLVADAVLEGKSSAVYDVNEDGKVSMADILFALKMTVASEASGEKLFSPSNSIGIYNYCPTVIDLEDGTRYIYYCTNKDSYNVIDYIGCRKGTLTESGYVWSDETRVLAPTSGSWDAKHTCDPSVIKGEFEYSGEEYSYLLAYLGCTSEDNQENKIGLAVAKSPEGPFVKIGTAPLIDFAKDPSISVFQWGVGQPCLVSKDMKSTVWMFYTRGDKFGTRTVVRECDFSDLDNPVLGEEITLSTNGLVTLDNATDIINNADFMYDADKNVFYSASDCHPNPANEPNYIASHFRLSSFSGTDFANASWKNIATVGESLTGYARNHNVGLVRDAYGHTTSAKNATVYYTVSVTGSLSLWSYRIHEYNFIVK